MAHCLVSLKRIPNCKLVWPGKARIGDRWPSPETWGKDTRQTVITQLNKSNQLNKKLQEPSHKTIKHSTQNTTQVWGKSSDGYGSFDLSRVHNIQNAVNERYTSNQYTSTSFNIFGEGIISALALRIILCLRVQVEINLSCLVQTDFPP